MAHNSTGALILPESSFLKIIANESGLIAAPVHLPAYAIIHSANHVKLEQCKEK